MLSDPTALDARGVLAAVGDTTRAMRQAGVDELLLALQWADIHSADPQQVPNAVPLSQGGDKLITLGGDGTPQASELCWSEFAVARHTGTTAAINLAADALDLRHRLPLTWQATQALRLPAWVARKVAKMSRRLSQDRVDKVDLAVFASAGTAPGKLLATAEAKVIEADPEAHRRRLAERAAAVGVFTSRRQPGDQVDQFGTPGTTRMTLNLPVGAVRDLDATIDALADKLQKSYDGPESFTQSQLRAQAAALLADPTAAAAVLDDSTSTPTRRHRATVFVHLTDQTLAGSVDGVIRVEQVGPLLRDQLADLVGHRQITVQPVLDLTTTRAVNAYEHPTDVRERTFLRTLGDVFPHSGSDTRRVDHDHPTPYDPHGPDGQTGDHNDAPLTRRHHRVKTHAGWTLRQFQPAVYRWTSPHGLGRLVTPQGTRTFTPIQLPAGLVGELYVD